MEPLLAPADPLLGALFSELYTHYYGVMTFCFGEPTYPDLGFEVESLQILGTSLVGTTLPVFAEGSGKTRNFQHPLEDAQYFHLLYAAGEICHAAESLHDESPLQVIIPIVAMQPARNGKPPAFGNSTSQWPRSATLQKDGKHHKPVTLWKFRRSLVRDSGKIGTLSAFRNPKLDLFTFSLPIEASNP